MKNHTTAVATAIRTIPALASKTFISTARVAGALPAAPYVVIHPSDGVDSQERFTGPHATANLAFTLHIVGTSYDNAQTVAELVKGKFIVSGLGVYLTITGENPTRCIWGSPAPIQVDDSLTPPLVYSVAELSFQSTPV